MQNLANTAVHRGFQLAKRENTAELLSERPFPITDTTVVLFFLALEIGSRQTFDFIEAGFGFAVLAAFSALPYWISVDSGRRFSEWLAGRAIISLTGLSIGVLLGLALDAGALPAAVRFVPLTLLIVAAIISCNYGIYAIIKNRLAR